MDGNLLYYGDNLDILRRYVRDETVDLIYLDPPFKSNQDYNILFAEQDGSRSAAQIKAFEDTWRWDQSAAQAFQEVVETGPQRVSQAMQAFRSFLGDNDMLSYLAMMAPRLVELHRVLKPTGSIYLHCDPTASHYLKMLMDAVFGPKNYHNEIIWKRTSARSDSHTVNHIHDVIFLYTKSDRWTWNIQYMPYDQAYVDQFYNHVGAEGRRFKSDDLTAAGIRSGTSGMEWRGVNPTKKGRHWAIPKLARAILSNPEEPDSIKALEELDSLGCILWPKKKSGVPRFARYLDQMPGMPLQSVWTDIPPVSAHAVERLGYPTQKPEALLERIVKSSSNEGDIVLDPFCGCGTTIAAAQRSNRRWIGIDITHLAITLIKNRLKDAFGDHVPFQVVGEPVDLGGAQTLAKQDPYQFQWWALGLVGARPVEQRKGADKGIDGRLFFHDEKKGKTKQIVLSVKSGHVSVKDVRDLRGVLEREHAEIGVLLTLEEPTQPMRAEAAGAGFYKSPWSRKGHPRMQVLTIEELLAGKQIDIPALQHTSVTFKKAPKARGKGPQRSESFTGEPLLP